MAPPRKTTQTRLAKLEADDAVLQKAYIGLLVATVQNSAQHLVDISTGIKRDAMIAAQAEQVKAISFVGDQIALRNLRLWYAQRAVMLASNDYTDILNTAASKSVDVLGLALLVGFAILPEISALGIVLTKFKKEEEALRTSWQAVTSGAKIAGKLFDLRKVYSGTSGGNSAGLKSANSVLQELYDSLLDGMVSATNAQSELTKQISGGQMAQPYLWIKDKWSKLNLPVLQPMERADLEDQSNVMAKVVLYDMLRYYTNKYVSVTFKTPDAALAAETQKDRDALNAFPNSVVDEVHGLNDNQREKIYQAFSSVPWKDPGRPRMSSWRDLILVWHARPYDTKLPDWIKH